MVGEKRLPPRPIGLPNASFMRPARPSFADRLLGQVSLPGVNNAVIEARSVVKKRVARARVRGKMRRVGYYSKIACRRTGVTRVQFVDEQGTRFTARKRVPGRC